MKTNLQQYFVYVIFIQYFRLLQTVTVLGTFVPAWLPPWPVEPVVLWLSLAEGALLPLLLLLADGPFRRAAGASCSTAPLGKTPLPRHAYRGKMQGATGTRTEVGRRVLQARVQR